MFIPVLLGNPRGSLEKDCRVRPRAGFDFQHGLPTAQRILDDSVVALRRNVQKTPRRVNAAAFGVRASVRPLHLGEPPRVEYGDLARLEQHDDQLLFVRRQPATHGLPRPVRSLDDLVCRRAWRKLLGWWWRVSAKPFSCARDVGFLRA
jgi:hypothetical protein